MLKRLLLAAVVWAAILAPKVFAQVPQGPNAVPAICSRGDSISNANTGSVDTLFGPGSVGVGGCGLFPATLYKSASGTFSTGVQIWASGHVVNNADAKTVRIQIGSAVLDSLIITASTANKFRFDCHVTVRTATGSGLQGSQCQAYQGDGTPTTVSGPGTVTFDPTVTQQAMVTINQAGANDVILDQIVVWQHQ